MVLGFRKNDKKKPSKSPRDSSHSELPRRGGRREGRPDDLGSDRSSSGTFSDPPQQDSRRGPGSGSAPPSQQTIAHNIGKAYRGPGYLWQQVPKTPSRESSRGRSRHSSSSTITVIKSPPSSSNPPYPATSRSDPSHPSRRVKHYPYGIGSQIKDPHKRTSTVPDNLRAGAPSGQAQGLWESDLSAESEAISRAPVAYGYGRPLFHIARNLGGRNLRYSDSEDSDSEDSDSEYSDDGPEDVQRRARRHGPDQR